MGETFSCVYTIRYFGVDGNLRISPSTLTAYLQDAAVLHSDHVGYDLEWFKEHTSGWAVLDWHIKVDKYPEEGQNIKISTWARPGGRVRFERSFSMEDETGEVICRAESKWVYMDTERRRPLKAPREMVEGYGCQRESNFPGEDFVLPVVPDGAEVQSRVFAVTRRDTDTNRHTNNAAYVEWATDDISDDVYFGYDMTEMRVSYKKECTKGSLVKSTCHVSRGMDRGIDDIEITSVFTDPQDASTVYCCVFSVWTKRDSG